MAEILESLTCVLSNLRQVCQILKCDHGYTDFRLFKHLSQLSNTLSHYQTWMPIMILGICLYSTTSEQATPG